MSISANQSAVSVIVPTYREVENLRELVTRIERIRQQHGDELELLIMDDDSGDGTDALVAEMNLPWVRLIVRKTNRGLSPAVMDGIAAARHDYVLIMDADLSHPPESIPAMIESLDAGNELVIGSRYVRGGTTDADWGLMRFVNSKVATWCARPFATVRDPMSGFFAFRKSALAAAAPLNPVGYKIGLEILVKCGFTRVAEVPIHFADRQRGESKLTITEQLRYLQHIRRLFVFKYPNRSYLLQFLIVGASGLMVNLAVLTLMLAAGAAMEVSIATAIAVSMTGNFLLNRRVTFSYARDGNVLRQFGGYVASCSLGAVVNYGVTLALLNIMPSLLPQIAAVFGVIAGTGLNFLMSRFLVFRPGPSSRVTDTAPAIAVTSTDAAAGTSRT